MITTQLLTEKSNTFLKNEAAGSLAFISEIGHNTFRVFEYRPNQTPIILLRDMKMQKDIFIPSMEARFKGWKAVTNELKLKL